MRTQPSTTQPSNHRTTRTRHYRLIPIAFAVALILVLLLSTITRADKMNGPIITDTTIQTSNAKIKVPTTPNKTYYWRVQSCQQTTCSPYTPFRKFTYQP